MGSNPWVIINGRGRLGSSPLLLALFISLALSLLLLNLFHRTFFLNYVFDQPFSYSIIFLSNLFPFPFPFLSHLHFHSYSHFFSLLLFFPHQLGWKVLLHFLLGTSRCKAGPRFGRLELVGPWARGPGQSVRKKVLRANSANFFGSLL